MRAPPFSNWSVVARFYIWIFSFYPGVLNHATFDLAWWTTWSSRCVPCQLADWQRSRQLKRWTAQMVAAAVRRWIEFFCRGRPLQSVRPPNRDERERYKRTWWELTIRRLVSLQLDAAWGRRWMMRWLNLIQFATVRWWREFCCRGRPLLFVRYSLTSYIILSLLFFSYSSIALDHGVGVGLGRVITVV